jgi:hypothetical protein
MIRWGLKPTPVPLGMKAGTHSKDGHRSPIKRDLENLRLAEVRAYCRPGLSALAMPLQCSQRSKIFQNSTVNTKILIRLWTSFKVFDVVRGGAGITLRVLLP